MKLIKPILILYINPFLILSCHERSNPVPSRSNPDGELDITNATNIWSVAIGLGFLIFIFWAISKIGERIESKKKASDDPIDYDNWDNKGDSLRDGY